MSGSYRLNYDGPAKAAALREWLESESVRLGGVILCRTIFSDVWVYWYPRLPQGDFMPSDYPAGYWKGGKLCRWSEKRVIRDQNKTPCTR